MEIPGNPDLAKARRVVNQMVIDRICGESRVLYCEYENGVWCDKTAYCTNSVPCYICMTRHKHNAHELAMEEGISHGARGV